MAKTVHEYVLEQTGATLKAKIEAAAQSLFSDNLGFPEVMPQNTFTYKLLLYYLDHKFTRDDLELWGLEADSTLQGLLEKYKGIFESEAWEIDPLTNYNLDTTRSGSLTSTQETSGSSSGSTSDTENRRDQASHGNTVQSTEHRSDNVASQDNTTVNDEKNGERHSTNKHSDTPQGGISGLTSGNYMSEADITDETTKDTDESTTERTGSESHVINGDTANVTSGQDASQAEAVRSGTSSSTTAGSLNKTDITGGTDHVEGYSGISPQRLTAEYREILDTYATKMIKECAVLFNLVFTADDLDL